MPTIIDPSNHFNGSFSYFENACTVLYSKGSRIIICTLKTLVSSDARRNGNQKPDVKVAQNYWFQLTCQRKMSYLYGNSVKNSHVWDVKLQIASKVKLNPLGMKIENQSYSSPETNVTECVRSQIKTPRACIMQNEKTESLTMHSIIHSTELGTKWRIQEAPDGEAWSCLARSLQLPSKAGGKPSSFSSTWSSSSIASNTLARSSACKNTKQATSFN